MLKIIIHNILSWFSLRPSRIWACSYIVSIPIFALIFWVMPRDWFGGNGMDGLFDALYFSVITITTLGFGDIFPINVCAKAAVVTESLIGIITIGLFLNEVAQYRADIAAQSEKERAEKARQHAEEIRLHRQYVVIKPHLDQYLKYATIVSTPIVKRKGEYRYNPDFPFQDLYDLYSPSLQLCDNFLEPAIVHFYRALHALESRLEIALQAVDLSIWPDIERQIITIISSIRKYDFESAIIGNINMTLGDKKATVVDSDMIKTWSDTIDFHPSNAINKYIALYYMIKETIPPLIILRSHILKLTSDETI